MIDIRRVHACFQTPAIINDIHIKSATVHMMSGSIVYSVLEIVSSSLPMSHETDQS